MAPRRRLVFGVLTVVSLLFVYTLYRKLESTSSISQQDSVIWRQDEQQSRPPPASTAQPELSTGTLQRGATQTPALKTQTLTAAKEQNPVGNKVNVRSDDMGKTCTKGPPLKPQQATRAAQPTEPPFIGDVYTIEHIPPQTDCPDGIRSKVAHTEFAGRFLKDIPVLQWAKHVTYEDYERLKKYPGAHGWGGIDYTTLEETLSVLNSPANWQMLDNWKDRGNKSKCIRCAVVGNGGILKDSKKGGEIDGHDYVFRTNGVIIEGFKEDVGSRTTHYTFSTNTLMNSVRSYSVFGYKGPPQSNETRYIFLPDHDRDYLMMKAAVTHTIVQRGPEHNKDPSKFFGQDVSKEKLKMYHPDFIRYLRNRFLRSNALKTRFKDIYRPSTGAVMLLGALHTCDQVSAYGFITPDYNMYSDHYYDREYRPVGFFINHDLRMEMALWQNLHHAGLIKLYMRN